MEDEFIVIGKIGRSHGLKGEVYIQLFLDEELLKNLPQLHIMKGDSYKPIELVALKPNGKKFLAKFSNINNKEDSELFKNEELYILKSELPDPEEGEYYYIDLIGCDCFWEDSYIGRVINVDDFGGGELFEIEHKGKTLFIPFMNRHIINISIDEKRIDFKDLEGYF